MSLAAGNAAALAALAGSERILALVLTAWLADIALRAGRLLAPTTETTTYDTADRPVRGR